MIAFAASIGSGFIPAVTPDPFGYLFYTHWFGRALFATELKRGFGYTENEYNRESGSRVWKYSDIHFDKMILVVNFAVFLLLSLMQLMYSSSKQGHKGASAISKIRLAANKHFPAPRQ